MVHMDKGELHVFALNKRRGTTCVISILLVCTECVVYNTCPFPDAVRVEARHHWSAGKYCLSSKYIYDLVGIFSPFHTSFSFLSSLPCILMCHSGNITVHCNNEPDLLFIDFRTFSGGSKYINLPALNTVLRKRKRQSIWRGVLFILQTFMGEVLEENIFRGMIRWFQSTNYMRKAHKGR